MQETILEIAGRVKELRSLSGFTPEYMAEKLDISVERYIRLENGEDEISASNLKEISVILGVDLTLLLTGEEPRMSVFTITRKGKGVNVERRSQYKYESLAPLFIHKTIEPFIVIAEPKDEEPTLHAHPGQEFNYILEGSLKIYINGNEITLEEGDSILFDSSSPHGMKALNGKAARFLAVIN